VNKLTFQSGSTAELVNEAIKQLGYSPNSLGRNLRKCETNIILAVIPSTEHTFYSEILRGMQTKALELGYDIVMSTSHSNEETEMRLLNLLFNRTVDAAILLGTRLSGESLNELNKKYNITLCCERVEGANCVTVTVDDERAAYDAVSCLIKKGHSKIGLISTLGTAFSSKDREKGYRRALEENVIAVNEDYIYRGSYEYRDGGYAVEKFLKCDEKPTAIFAVSDLLAVGAINKAVKRGLNVGNEFAVIGFDNLYLSELYLPSVSTIAQSCYLIGSTAVEKTISNLNTPHMFSGRYFIDHYLVLRQSTGD
jgi:LacI family transcriptional regulator/LacI family repressor for deo operon, udp, cdd, tsx, nupC, and nupG